jgi:predicted dehydrogenase
MMAPLRIGLIGAGGNTRARHIPGLRAIPGVEIVAVCNRRPESTAAAAHEFHIPRTFERWQDLVADPGIDAVVIGTWPYLHCPVTHAALDAGKHVLTEARMAMNAAEAHRMLAAARRRPGQVAQIVPSPFGLAGGAVVLELIRGGYLGELREVEVVGRGAALADPAAPLHWRQDAALSGLNMLTLGILHETLLRWAPPPARVLAQVHAFIPTRIDPEGGVRRMVGTPDSVQVLAVLEGGARAVYQFSGVTPFGGGSSIRLLGSDGVLHYDLDADKLYGLSRAEQDRGATEPREVPIPPEKRGAWRVEADWVDSIRAGAPVRLTDFATGVAYMEFTEAVARSAETGAAKRDDEYQRRKRGHGKQHHAQGRELVRHAVVHAREHLVRERLAPGRRHQLTGTQLPERQHRDRGHRPAGRPRRQRPDRVPQLAQRPSPVHAGGVRQLDRHQSHRRPDQGDGEREETQQVGPQHGER